MNAASSYNQFSSFSDWRNTWKPNRAIVNQLQKYTYESVVGSLDETLKVAKELIASNVPPGHLLVMLLYQTSHHHKAKNVLPLLAELIQCGAPPTVNGMSPPKLTALHVSAARGSEDLLKLVLEEGGPNLDIDVVTTYGHTPLEIALHSRQYRCVVQLLWYGADPVPKKIYDHIMSKPKNEQIECYKHFSSFFNSVEDIANKIEVLIRPRDIVSTLMPFVVPLRHKNTLKTALDRIEINHMDLETTEKHSLNCSIM